MEVAFYVMAATALVTTGLAIAFCRLADRRFRALEKALEALAELKRCAEVDEDPGMTEMARKGMADSLTELSCGAMEFYGAGSDAAICERVRGHRGDHRRGSFSWPPR